MNPIRTVLIVGGGSSGWMTAALLSRLPDLEVTLIEASDIPIIGVGESTNAVTKHFHRLAGIDEKGFMRESNAAFKIAIRFEHFHRKGGMFLHPFGAPPDRARCFFRPNAQAHYPASHVARAHNRFSTSCSYTYQLDAGLYAGYLKHHARRGPGGVRHVVDRVRGVELAPGGDIACVHTEQSGPLSADLYVDSSGFQALLLDKTLREPFHSVQRHLLNDRAIAARVPYIDRDRELRTYTNCVALSAGWVWEIPLWSRLGTGYVYSSAFLTRPAAEAEFRHYLGPARVKDLTFSHIDIRAGRHARAWVGNCVAIGVSYGFLEPLESTGLSLTQTAILDLAAILKRGAGGEAAESFNGRQAEMFDTTRDFVTAHFVLTRRDDSPYWRHIQYDVPRPDSLREILEHAAAGSFKPIDARSHLFYRKHNWNLILSGMGFFDGTDEAVCEGLRVPETELHATLLRGAVYDGDYLEPPLDAADDELAHPVWFPTW